MNTSKCPKLPVKLLAILLCLSVTGLPEPANALTVGKFELLDNTLYLNTDATLKSGRRDFKRDYGRRALREMGVRAEYVRAMVRMGRRLDFFVRDARVINDVRHLRYARMLQLRRDLGIARVGRDLRVGRYLFTRGIRDVRRDLYAHFGVYNNNQLVWSVTDFNGGNVFAMLTQAVPLPASWILFITGLAGLIIVTRFRPHRNS